MKWYSVKKHGIPVNSGHLFVALKVEELCAYDMAQYTHNFNTDRFDWFNKDGNVLTQVTHFCIPAPVDKEEEAC